MKNTSIAKSFRSSNWPDSKSISKYEIKGVAMNENWFPTSDLVLLKNVPIICILFLNALILDDCICTQSINTI